MKEKLKLIGKKSAVKAGGMTIDVKVLDYKYSYGHDRFLVTPLSGEGEVWVEKLTK